MYACSARVFEKQSASQGYNAAVSLANGASVSIVNGKVELFEQDMPNGNSGNTI